MSSNWIKQEGVFYPVGDFKTYRTPGPGIFTVFYNEMTHQLGLRKYADKFEFPFKVYDLGLDSFNKMIKSVWDSEYFVKKNQNLGIIFNGLKGAGKTIGAKLLCNSLDYPVILIQDYIPGTLEFIGRLEFECIVLIDEAEKTFDGKKNESSHTLLKMIDGVMNKSRKLYILTTNSLDINENLIGRPGRIRYIKEVGGITDDSVTEYIKDNMLYEDMLIEVMKVVKSLKTNTIDTLKCIVDEVNMTHSLNSLEYLNLELKRKCYFTLTFNPKEYPLENLEKCMDFIRENNLTEDNTLVAWLLEQSKDKNNKQRVHNIEYPNLIKLHDAYGIELTSKGSTIIEPRVGCSIEDLTLIEETVDGWFKCMRNGNIVFAKFIKVSTEEESNDGRFVVTNRLVPKSSNYYIPPITNSGSDLLCSSGV